VLGYLAAIVIAGIENAVMMVGVIDRSWKLKLTVGPNQGCPRCQYISQNDIAPNKAGGCERQF
jgi:hypothetical protein